MLLLALVASTLLASDPPGDVVYLAAGGRLVGTVTSSSPLTGVKVMVLDGSIRTLRTDEVRCIRYGSGAGNQACAAEASDLLTGEASPGTTAAVIDDGAARSVEPLPSWLPPGMSRYDGSPSEPIGDGDHSWLMVGVRAVRAP